MELDAARRLAEAILGQFPSLFGWTVAFSPTARRCIGICRHSRRQIQLSAVYVELNDQPAVLDIILHEIAHALVGAEHGHGPVWKAKCLEIGARPDRFVRGARLPPPTFIAVCPACRWRYNRYGRAPRPILCSRCGPASGPLTFVPHPEARP